MIRRVCLLLPTNRECADTISLLAKEAEYAVHHFDVEVCLLILDTCIGNDLSINLRAIRELLPCKNVTTVHLNSEEQKHHLQKIIDKAGIRHPDQILNLMLPNGVSYGACTNRAFLISKSLNCDSIHRRDSDSRYQVINGTTVFPIHQELISLGKKASHTEATVSEVLLDPSHKDKPVSMVGGSFIGEMSVDIGEIYMLNRDIYFDIVSLWAERNTTQEEKQKLIDISFKGAGTDKFSHDWSTLSIVNPMNIDMCNISFYQVHEDVPLPPATDTIGSDYFLMHVVECACLPGVYHNRHIENFYTPGRKSGAGFIAYHMRLTKFFLSMIYFHDIYKNMARIGESLLDSKYRILIDPIIKITRESLKLDKKENEHKLNVLIDAYTGLGGQYASFGELIAGQRPHLLLKAEQDMSDFCMLMEAWSSLINASKTTYLSESKLHSNHVHKNVSCFLKREGQLNMIENSRLGATLAKSKTNCVVFDLEGIRMQYDLLLSELPEVDIRFALKSCPVDEILSTLAEKGAGFDAASVNEIQQALKTGVPAKKVHFGNTIKSNQQIADAYRLGIRDFATDSLEDVEAIAKYTAGSNVFCRLSTDGEGALWGLNRKFGCSETDALVILQRAKARGLKPAGLSVHVGSQQMKAQSWQKALNTIATTVRNLSAKGIKLDYINLGGGLPAVGYTDRSGKLLVPPFNEIFSSIRSGMQEIKKASGNDINFIIEPGRYLVADQGAIKAQVIRLTTRQLPNGEHQYWLYISCGKFSGLYETDALQYRLVFPSHSTTEYVPAIIAGPTCDSDDMFPHDNGPIYVPRNLVPGDPVWILSCGAYSVSYMTKGFNGFEPPLITMVALTGKQLNSQNTLPYAKAFSRIKT